VLEHVAWHAEMVHGIVARLLKLRSQQCVETVLARFVRYIVSTALWTPVGHGSYGDYIPTIGKCEKEGRCSRPLGRA
jgi:hypothetical protein